MKVADVYADQLEREAAISRRLLERVPGGKDEWKPHEKSMAFGYLAHLVATMPSWVEMAIRQDELDLNPPGGPGFKMPAGLTGRDLVKLQDEAVPKALAALRGASEEFLTTPWRLLVATKVVMESPRIVVVADSLTHLAHHRGQLTVYLRLLGIALPSVYGPSADDRTFG